MLGGLWSDPFDFDPFGLWNVSGGGGRGQQRGQQRPALTSGQGGGGQQQVRRGGVGGDLVSWNDPLLGQITTRWADDMNVLSLNTLLSEPLHLEVQEKEHEIDLIARSPQGIRRKDLHVEVQGNTLTISGERMKTKQRRTGTREEYLSFSRSIVLPEHVNTEKIAAKFDENSNLVIKVPKEAGVGPRNIQIEGVEKLKEEGHIQSQTGGVGGGVQGQSKEIHVQGGKEEQKDQPMHTEKESVRGKEPRTQTV